MFAHTAQSAFLDHFLDPNIIRWELHRVWVVEATLHPGERNVLARRRFYVDEDTWNIGVSDAWDGSGNLYKVNTCYNNHRPDLPGTIYMANVVTNLQTGDYCTPSAIWNQKAHPTLRFVDDIPDSEFDPQVMAASGQY